MRRNNTIIIAGAGTLLGEKVLNKLKSYEINLILLDQNINKLHELQNKYKGYGVNIEVQCINWTNREEVDNIFNQIYEEYELIDALISLIDSVYLGSPINKLNYFQVEEMVNINFLCNLHIVAQVLPIMLEEDHGTIIVLGEGISLQKNIKNSIYRATKGALSIFWRELKRLCNGKNVQLALVHYNNPIPLSELEQSLPDQYYQQVNDKRLSLLFEQLANMIDAITFKKHCKKINVVNVG